MRYLAIILMTCFIHSNASAKNQSPNPGDILFTGSFNAFNHVIRSDARSNDSEVQFFGNIKLAYHLVNGLYAGGVYHNAQDDENSKNSLGINLTYVYKTLHIGATYILHSNHKVDIDTAGQELDAELEKGQGFMFDLSYNFPITKSFYIGIGVNYFSVSYDEIDYNDTSITDDSISDDESYFMPMVRLTYFFGTHGKRIHESTSSKKKSRVRL